MKHYSVRYMRRAPWGFRLRYRPKRLESTVGRRAFLLVFGFRREIIITPQGAVALDQRDGLELLA